MLLPSALPCDLIMTAYPSKAQRPGLPSFAPYEKPQTTQPTTPMSITTSATGGIFASCRALQSLLGGASPAMTAAVTLPLSNAPVPPRSPIRRRKLQSPPRIVTPPRGLNKRCRDEFEEDDEPTPRYLSHAPPREQEKFQTPKRQRRVPADIPLGLSISDFDMPLTAATPRQQKPPPPSFLKRPITTQILDVEITDSPETFGIHKSFSSSSKQLLPAAPRLQPSSSSLSLSSRHQQENRTNTTQLQKIDENNDVMEDIWSPTRKDRHFVENFLSRLDLSKRDWSDCARQPQQQQQQQPDVIKPDRNVLGQRQNFWRTLMGN